MSKKQMLSMAFYPWMIRRHYQLLAKIKRRNRLESAHAAVPDALQITKDDNRFMKAMLSLIRLHTKE